MPSKSPVSPAVWAAGLVLITVVVYGRTATFQFVNFDDGVYVFQSPIVMPGITPRTLGMAFTRFDTANWHPLTWLSLMFDRTVFGMNPQPFHVVNVLLHIASTLVLFQTLREATGQSGRSALVAALFAIHPLHVESVAWIAERKDVLSGLFWMLTLWAYGRYARHPSRTRGAAVFAFLLVGLLAKQMLVTLPFVLLLLDLWPLRRWKPEDGWVRLWPLVREKLPLFALIVVFSVVVFIAQRAGKAVQSLETLSIAERLSNAIVSYVMYLVKMVWPFNLAVFYPYHVNDWPMPAVAAGVAGLVAVTGLCLWKRPRNPALLVGWLWYLGTLVPVIGLVQVGGQAMADRYTYLPLIGIFLMLAWGVPWDALVPSRIAGAAGLAVVLLLAVRASGQVGTWYDSQTLFEHALDVAPSSVACNNLGMIVRERGDPGRAEELFRQATRLDSRNTSAWNNLAVTVQQRGDLAGAEALYRKALSVNPEYVEALISYGDLMNTAGKQAEAKGQALEAAKAYLEAERLLRQAVSLNPDSPGAHLNLGVALFHQGRTEEAVDAYRRSLEIKPNNELAHQNLGWLYAQSGRYREAVEHLQQALSYAPEQHDARYLLASVYAQEQQFDQALIEIATVLEADPQHAPARQLRDQISRALGQRPGP